MKKKENGQNIGPLNCKYLLIPVNRRQCVPRGHSSNARPEKCAANVVVVRAGEVLTFPH